MISRSKQPRLRRRPRREGRLDAFLLRGEGGQLGKPFESGLTIEGIMTTARSGVAGTSMPPFGNAYTLEQLHDVASHIVNRVLPQR